jgi:hypothetical protein
MPTAKKKAMTLNTTRASKEAKNILKKLLIIRTLYLANIEDI